MEDERLSKEGTSNQTRASERIYVQFSFFNKRGPINVNRMPNRLGPPDSGLDLRHEYALKPKCPNPKYMQSLMIIVTLTEVALENSIISSVQESFFF